MHLSLRIGHLLSQRLHLLIEVLIIGGALSIGTSTYLYVASNDGASAGAIRVPAAHHQLATADALPVWQTAAYARRVPDLGSSSQHASPYGWQAAAYARHVPDLGVYPPQAAPRK